MIKLSLKINQQRTCDKNRNRILNIKHISHSLEDNKGAKITFHEDIIEILYVVCWRLEYLFLIFVMFVFFVHGTRETIWLVNCIYGYLTSMYFWHIVCKDLKLNSMLEFGICGLTSLLLLLRFIIFWRL